MDRFQKLSVRYFLSLLVFLLVPVFCCAENSVNISVQENEWSWVPGEVATFSGSVISENPSDLSGTVIQLEIIPEPKDEDTGRIVFTAVNDKRIKIRKQSESYSVGDEDLTGDISFEGSWFIPEGSAFSRANLNVRVLGNNGDQLASGTLSIGSGAAESNHSLLRIPVDINRLNMIIAVCTGLVCCLAIIRVFICSRVKSIKHEKEL